MLKQVREPQFVSSAYFLKFRFEKGHYALAGREKIGDVNALKIEYYPESGLFKDGRTKPDKKVKDKDDSIEDEDEQGLDGDAVDRSSRPTRSCSTPSTTSTWTSSPAARWSASTT